jgi:hypothetical protein
MMMEITRPRVDSFTFNSVVAIGCPIWQRVRAWRAYSVLRGGTMHGEGGGDVGASGIDALVLTLRFHEFAVDPAQIRHRCANAPFGVPEILR